MKKRIKVPLRLKATLQQEIDSECPFCNNRDIEVFELHHIDTDPSNNKFENLIMLCSSCHSKIEKKIITKEEVDKKKNQLALKSVKVELVSIVVDEKKCSWSVSEHNPFAFFDAISTKSPFPLFNFTFINHTPRTIVLKTIEAKYKHLYSGLSGPPSEPGTLKPIAKYSIHLIHVEKPNIYQLLEPLYIPSQHPALFQIDFSEGYKVGEFLQIEGRRILNLTFHFNDSISVIAPSIFLNCESDTDTITSLILA